MLSSFSGLEIGFSGLQANQKALEVTGHNISNASNDSYSRQEVVMKSTMPLYLPSFSSQTGVGYMGTGTMVDSIKRVRDVLIDNRVLQENVSLGYWDKMESMLHQLEMIYNEPSDSSLRSAIDDFWGSLQDMANSESPTEMSAAKALVKERAITLTQTVNEIYSQFQELGGAGSKGGGENAIDTEIKADIEDINGWAKEIAGLNKQILAAQGADQEPNDLLDRRDYLISQISSLINVKVNNSDPDDYRVLAGGMVLAQGVNSYEFEAKRDPLDNNLKMYYKEKDIQVYPMDGEIKALMDFRDEILPSHMQNLNELAINFTDKFNEIHRNGFGSDDSTNIDFFKAFTQKTSGIYKLTGNTFIRDLDKPLAGDLTTTDPENFEKRVGRSSSSTVSTSPNDLKLDITQKFDKARFATTIDTNSQIKIGVDRNNDGTIDSSEQWTSDKLSNYKSVQEFMDKINYSSNKVLENIKIYYNDRDDKFTIINTDGTEKVHLEDVNVSSNSGFFGAAKIPNIATSDISYNVVSDRLPLSSNSDGLVNADDTRLSINSHSIYYDSKQDTIQDIIKRINDANCGVRASLDPTQRLTLTATKENDYEILSIEDTGNLLSTLGILATGKGYFGAITDERNIMSKNLDRPPIDDAAFVFQVSDEIKNDINKIAAAGGEDTNLDGFLEEANGPADNTNALKLAGLKDSAVMMNGTTTFNDFFSSMISDVAVQAKTAKSNAENKDMLVTNLKNAQKSVSGVSLDEEMTNMIKFQQGYTASAKFIGTYQNVIDTLLSLVG